MKTPIHILSLGAGVQSSTIALMASKGEITPKPQAAVFSDTQAEPMNVYTWLDWLTQQLSFPVLKITNGSLSDVSLTIREHSKKPGKFWSKSLIPAYIANKDGTRGIMGRSCTADFKITPLIRKTKQLIGSSEIQAWKKKHAEAYKAFTAACKIKHPCPSWAWDEMQNDPLAIQLIGISLDEVQRMKPSRIPFIRHRWPLIDMEMTRHDCLRWMEINNFPKPPRSACVYCPFHSDTEWRRLKTDEPAEFARAVEFEKLLQHVKTKTDNLDGIPFLHNSLKNIDEIDFSSDEEKGQGMLHGFGNECEGMCGV